MENDNLRKNLKAFQKQPLVIYLITSLTFLLILFRLIFLQILNNENYKKMSDENRIRLIASEPIRGRIIDKNGLILADSKIKYSLIIKPQYVSESNWQKYKLKIADLLDFESDQLQKKIY